MASNLFSSDSYPAGYSPMFTQRPDGQSAATPGQLGVATPSSSASASRLVSYSVRARAAVAAAALRAAEEDFKKQASARQRNFELQMIKARTMDNMVVQLKGGKKMVYLTNAQAAEIRSHPAYMDTLLHAFCTHTPKLIINLLFSGGFSDITGACDVWEGAGLVRAP